MVDFRTIRRVFQRTRFFRTLVLGTLRLNFLVVGYFLFFLTDSSDFGLGLLGGLFVYLFTGVFIYSMVFGPLVLGAFFIHLSRASEPVTWWDLSSIPEGSTLYDAIMLPTVIVAPSKSFSLWCPRMPSLRGLKTEGETRGKLHKFKEIKYILACMKDHHLQKI